MMQFRPCIDIHNGKVKQIVGATLTDAGNQAAENFVAEKNADYYASLYKENGLTGGHVILLNAKDSAYYEDTKAQAELALAAYPGGLQVGGGVTAENAAQWIAAGASHVIVTSYVFKDGKINYENLERLEDAVGSNHIVLDLSCKEKDGAYYIVTDRWQNFTEEKVDITTLSALATHCDEFLIHAAHVEGKRGGIDEKLVKLLGEFDRIPVTYAGGVGGFEDLEKLRQLGGGRVHVTIGSALDLFGGSMNFDEIVAFCGEK